MEDLMFEFQSKMGDDEIMKIKAAELEKVVEGMRWLRQVQANINSQRHKRPNKNMVKNK
jgi:hypothetical protein